MTTQTSQLRMIKNFLCLKFWKLTPRICTSYSSVAAYSCSNPKSRVKREGNGWPKFARGEKLTDWHTCFDRWISIASSSSTLLWVPPSAATLSYYFYWCRCWRRRNIRPGAGSSSITESESVPKDYIISPTRARTCSWERGGVATFSSTMLAMVPKVL